MTLRDQLRQWSRRGARLFGSSIVYGATAGLAVLALALVLGLGSVSYLVMRDLADRWARDRIAADLDLIRERAEQPLNHAMVELSALAQNSLVSNALVDSDGREAYLVPLLRDFAARRPWLQSPALRDFRGRVVVGPTAGSHTVPPELFHPYRTDPVATLARDGSNKLYATVVFPVSFVMSGSIEGYLTALVDLEGSARDALDRSSGNLTARVIALTSPSGAGIAQRTELRLQAPLATLELGIEATVASERAFGELDRLRHGFMLVALLAVLIVVPLAAILVRQVTRPLVRLTAAVSKVAESGLGSARELQVRGNDELSKLARSFNRMLHALRESQQTLELRVEQRTRELADTQARLESIVGSLRDVIVSLSPDGRRVLYLSSAAKTVFGIEPERFYVEPGLLRQVILPGDYDDFLRAVGEATSDAETHVEFRVEATDGAMRWLEMRMRLTRDGAGTSTRVDGVLSDITDRVIAETEHSYALGTLRLKDRALDSSSNGIVISDMRLPDSPIIYANKAFERMTGYKPAEVHGINCRFLQGEDTEQHEVETLRQAIAAGRGCQVVLRNYRKDGTLFWNELTVSPVHDEEGKVTHFIGIQNDISERVAAEQALRLSEKRKRAILNAALDCIITIDDRGRIVEFNPAAERTFGYLRDDVIGRDLAECIIPPDLRDAHSRGLEQYGESAEGPVLGRRVEIKAMRSSGEVFPVELAITPIKTEQATYYTAYLRDITERVHAQAEIAERSERLDAIFSLSPDGFVTIDSDGFVSAVNPAFERMTGIGREEIAGRDERRLETMLRQLADPRQPWPGLHDGSSEGEGAGNEAGRDTTLALIRPTPAIIQHRIRCSGSRLASRILYFRDITRESEVDRMKSEFLSTAAHELRTPMASIRGFCELLLKRKYDEATQRDLLDTINRQAVRLTNLLNELLDLARIEARRGKDFKFKVQPLKPLVQEVVAGMIFEKDPRKVQVNIACEVPQVNVDHEKLQQALMNVLGNAYKYSPNGGAIELTVLREAGERGRVGVRVKDHGIGMSPEHAARAFERFFRADTSGNIPGTGLGLSLVKEIIELHGGEVKLQSVAGQGTTVTIWLPVVAQEAEALPA